MAIDTEETAPSPPVEELVFLCRSHHRIQLLTQLSREEQTRRDLHDATGISQPTLGRILGDFEQRRWISNHHNGAYTLTPLGELLADAVDSLLGVLDTTDQLTDLADHLPFERLDFDLSHLATATITTPSSGDPFAHMRRFDELASGATTVKMFSNVLSCAPSHESSDGDREFLTHVDELIVTNDALTSDLDDSELRGWLSGRIDDGALSICRYDGPAIFLFGIFDDTVGLVPIDDDGMPCGLVEATADPVQTWARDTFEEYRRAGSHVAPDELSI
jgi:predicted transcriptional regulator